MGLGKSMNGANLHVPVFLLEVNGTNPVFYLYFLSRDFLSYFNVT